MNPESPESKPESVVDESTDTVSNIPEAKAVSLSHARDFRTLIARYIRRHLPDTPADDELLSEPPGVKGGHEGMLPLLRMIPWGLGLVFIFSFFWDFPSVTYSVLGSDFVLDGLLRIISVSGLIGFLTNWVAITMLFNPRQVRPIFGQGLIPAQRERVIYRLARAVSDELINEEIIKQKIEENEIIPRYREMAVSVTRGVLEDEEFRVELKKLTSNYVETVLTSEEVRRRIVEYVIEKIQTYVGDGFGGMALKAYRYVGEDDFKNRIDKAVFALPDQLDLVLDEMDSLLDVLPEKIEARSDEIEAWATRIVLGFVENLDVYSMIMSNMSEYDESRLEDLLKKSTNEQLNYIKYLGGALGALGGFVIWRPVPALLFFGALGGLLFGIDEILYRLRRG